MQTWTPGPGIVLGIPPGMDLAWGPQKDSYELCMNSYTNSINRYRGTPVEVAIAFSCWFKRDYNLEMALKMNKFFPGGRISISAFHAEGNTTSKHRLKPQKQKTKKQQQ